MEPLVVYIIKVNVALAFFVLFHKIFLSNDTFVALKRYFFLGAIIFSFAYPFAIVPEMDFLQSIFQKEAAATNAGEIEIGEMLFATEAEAESPVVFYMLSLAKTAKFVAIFITVLLVVRLVWQLFSIVNIRRRSSSCTLFGIHVRRLSDSISPFSFFKWIFLNPESHSEPELRQIVLHEHTHAVQLHSFDILLVELVCVLFWWNPAVWLMRSEIIINLEYLADNAVLRRGVNRKQYQYHLLRLTYSTTPTHIVSNFNVSQLKQRITMMNKMKSPTRKLAKYLFVLPVAALMMTVNSGMSMAGTKAVSDDAQSMLLLDAAVAQQPDSLDKVHITVDKMPQFEGGIVGLSKYLSTNIEYPAEAQKNNIEGRVICNFIVEKDGSISDVKIVRGVDPLLDAEAIRVVKAMPNWTPGEINGEPARVLFTLPIVFSLKKTDDDLAERVVVGRFSADKKAVSPPPPPSSPLPPTKTVEGSEVFIVVENQPSFPGGTDAMIKFLSENIKYPADAEANGIEGRVICNFIIEKDGKVTDVKAVRSVSPSLDKEAIRVIESMPDWIPGKQRGETVRVRYTLPVIFKLTKNDKAAE